MEIIRDCCHTQGDEQNLAFQFEIRNILFSEMLGMKNPNMLYPLLPWVRDYLHH